MVIVLVAWKKVCSDQDERGLGTKSLICLNEATNLKQCWNLLQSEEKWASILIRKIIRRNRCISYHISSSIWSNTKAKFQTIQDNTTWLIGDGADVNFWIDSWCGDPIAQTFNISDDILQQFPQNLSSYILNNHWNISEDLNFLFPNLRSLITKVIIPIQRHKDKLIWPHSSKGDLSLKDAYIFKKHNNPKISWAKCIWSKDIAPSKSLLVWRFMLDKLPTDENLAHRGCNLPSMCSLCAKQVEASFYLFLDCPYVVNIWC